MSKTRYNGKLRKSFTIDGKRYYAYGVDQAELFADECRIREELINKKQDLHNPRLDDYYDYFTKIRRTEIKESTIRAQRSQYENIGNAVMPDGNTFGSIRIRDITRRDIEMVRQILLSEGKTPQNLNICFSHLNHVFSSAALDETIEKNPCRALKQLKRNDAPISETKHRALTQDETVAFFAAAEKRNSYYYNDFLLLIKTGLRIGELAALYPFDVDKKSGFIHIRRTIQRDEVGAYFVGNNTKTYSGKRDIPLTDEIEQIIHDQMARNRDIFQSDGLLFRSAEGQILREYSANREIDRICKDAKIEKFTCHSFRNTFATRFIEQRPQDYKILSEILGHKDVSITLNLYTHVMTENKVRAMEELKVSVK